MSNISWTRNLLKLWTRSKSDKAKRRPFRNARPWAEQLEVREVLTGALSLTGNALLLADAGAPTITVAYTTGASNHYTITDNNTFSSVPTGWTGVGTTTATGPSGSGASITQLSFQTTGAALTSVAAPATASISITDAATATITGTNSFNGGLFVQGGTLQVGSAGAVPAGEPVTVASGATLDLAGNNVSIASLNGAGTVENTASSTTAMLTVTAGGSFSGVIQDGSANSATAVDLDGGTLTLSGANSFTGGLTIQAGTFIAGGDTSGTTGAAGNTNTAIQLGTATTTSASLEAGTFTVANPINVGSNGTLTLGNDGGSDDAYFSGSVILHGDALTISATGTADDTSGNSPGVIVSGSITGTGNLVLNNSSMASASGMTPAGTILLGFPPPGNHSGPPPAPNNINNTGTITNVGTSTGLATISNNILTNVTGVYENATANGSPLVLAGTNTFLTDGTHSGLIVLGGTVDAAQTSAALSTGTITLGSTTGNVPAALLISTSFLTVTNNIHLASNANLSGVGGLTIGSTQDVAIGRPTDATATFTGTVSGSNDLTIAVGGNGNVIFSGPLNISGTIANDGTGGGEAIISSNLPATVTGITENGTSNLVLSGTNANTGADTITAGELSVGTDANLGSTTGTPSSIVFGGGALQITGANVTSASGGNIGSHPYSINSGATAGFDINDSTNTFTISDALTGNVGLEKLGEGTLVLTNANTYTRPTLINAGVLQLGNDGTTGSLSPSSTIVDNSTYVYDFNGGTPNLTIPSTFVINRSNTVTQGTDFSSSGFGTLSLAGDTANGSTTVSNVDTTLLATGMPVSGPGIPDGDVIASIDDATSFELLAPATADGTGVSLTFTETGGLANSGSGTTILTANNTYSGPTSVYNGVLQVGNGGTSGSFGTGVVNMGNGNLVFDRSDLLTVSNVIQNVTGATAGGSAPATTVANPGHDMVQTDPTTGKQVADTAINMHDVADANGQVYAYHWGATGSDRPGQIPVIAPFNPIAVQAVGNTVGSGALFYLTTNESTQFTSPTAATLPVSYTAGSNTVTLTSGTIAGYGISIGQVVEGAGILTVPADANGGGGPGAGANPTGTFITSVDTVHNTFTLNIAPSASGTSLLLPALANLQANGIGGVQIVSGGGSASGAPGAVNYTSADVGKILTVAQGQGTFSIGTNPYDDDGLTPAGSLTPNSENYANPNVTPAQLMITSVANGQITGVELLSPGTYQAYSPVLPGDQTYAAQVFTGSVSGNTLTVSSFITGTDAVSAAARPLAVGQVVQTNTNGIVGLPGTDIPAYATITALNSVNPDGTGTYTLSTALPSFTGSISGNTLTVSAADANNLAPGDTITGTGIPAGTTITDSGTDNGDGTFSFPISATLTIASETMNYSIPDQQLYAQTITGFKGSISANVLTVDAGSLAGSPLVVGDVFYAPGVTVGTAITAQLSGTPGGAGTYQLATLAGVSPLTVADESMTAQFNQTLTTSTGAQLPIESNMISPALTQPTAVDNSDQSGGPDGYGSALGHEVTTAYEMTSAHEYYAPFTGDTTAGSKVINNAVDTSVAMTPFAVGFAVDGPGIPAGAVITAVSGSSITLSQAATVTATGSSFDSWNEWTSAIDPNTIAVGGSGYTNGATVVALGGVTAAAGTPLLGTVTTTGGVVTGFTASNALNNGFQGDASDAANWYSVLPTVPCPVTGGSGTGNPLFNLTMNDVLTNSQSVPTGIGIATVVSGHGGSGYALGDVLTLSAPAGITPVGTAATLTVTAVDGSGAILAVNVQTAGSYTKWNPATLFYVAPVDGSGGSGAILSWQALQTSVPDNASSALSPDAAVVNGGGYAVGDVLVVSSTSSWTDSQGNQATWTVAPILQVTHYTYSASGSSFTYNLINTPVSSTGDFPLSSDTFNLFPLGYTPATTIVGPYTYNGAGVNGGVAEFAAGATVNFGPQVFGGTPGSVIQLGTGTTILTGTNTYTGPTNVINGTLEATRTASLPGYNTSGSGRITVNDGATLAVQFGGTGQFTSADVDTLLSHATFSDGAGTATLGLDVTGTNTATYASVIADPSNGGSLAVEKLGTGKLTLSGANSFTGGLTIQAGTFIAGVSNSGTTGAAGNTNTAIQLGTATTTSASLEAGTFAVANPINVGSAGALTLGNDGGSDDAYFSGAITLNGNALTIAATGTSSTARIVASGSITGAGNLVLNNSSSAGSIWIGFPPPSDVHAGPPQSPNNISNTGTITNIGTSSGLTTISNIITTHVTGVYQNTGSLTASPLVLAGPNTFTSGLNIQGGTVDAAQVSGALGANTNVVTLGNTTGSVPAALLISTSFLQFSNPIQLATNTNLSGVGGLTIGTTQAVVIGRPTDATATFSGNVTGNNNLTINVAGNGNLIFTGALNISGAITNNGTGIGTTIISSNLSAGVTGVTENGTSNLILSGTNANTGADTITAGELSVGADANLGATSGTPSSIVFNGGTLQITGTSLMSASGGFIGSHPYSITPNTTAGFDINDPNNTFTISDALTQGTGGLTKLGAGTLVLTNANTYTGTTLIGGGTLQLGNGGTTGSLSTSSTIVDNSAGAFGILTTPGVFAIDRSNTVTQGTDFSGSGIGTVSLTGNTAISLSGSLTNHSTTVSGLASTAQLATGMLVSGTGIPAGDTIATIASGTSITLTTAATSTRTSTLTFRLTGGPTSSTTVNGLASTALLAPGMVVAGAGIPAGDKISTIASATSITLTTAATAVATGAALTFTETGGLANSGSGTTILTAANTYAGPTSVYSGVLQVGNGGTTGTLGTGVVTIGSGNLVFDRTDTMTVPNVIQNLTGGNPGGSAPVTTGANPGHDMVQSVNGVQVADSSINMHDYVNSAGQLYQYHWGATGSDRPGQIPVLAPFDPIAVQAVGNTVGSGALFYLTTNESTQNTSPTAPTIPVTYTAGSNKVTLSSGTIAGYGISIGQVVEGTGIATFPADVNGNGGPGVGTSPTGTFITSVDTVHNTFTLSIAPTASGTSLVLPALANLQASGIGGVQIVSGGGNAATEPGAVPYTQADVGKILTVAQGLGTFSIGINGSLTPNPENYANPNVMPAQLIITQVNGGTGSGAITGVAVYMPGTYQPYSPVETGDQTLLDPIFSGSVSGTTLTVDSFVSGTDAPYAYGFNLTVGQTVFDSSGDSLGTITGQLTGPTGGIGTYTLSQSSTITDTFSAQTTTSITGSISANVLTVSSPTGSPIVVGDTISGTGIPIGTAITAQLTGTTGGAGTYQLATLTGASLTVSSESMTAQLNQTLTTSTGAQLPIESNMLSPALTQPTALDTSDQNGAPSGYGSGLGHEVTTAYEMTSQHELYAPLTGDTTAGSNMILNVVDTSPAGTPYAVGYAVDGPGIPAGAVITAINASSITLSQNATVTATGSSFDSWNEWTSAIDPNTIAAGGSGYTNGATVVALGGVTAAGGAPLLGTVTTSGGVVTGFVASDATNNGFQGDAADSANWYSVLPTVPCPVTGGSGTGNPLFNLTMNDPLNPSATSYPINFATGIGTATLVSGTGGSGYHIGDVLTLSAPAGITPVGTAATLTVTAVDGSGAILAVNVTTAGSYTKWNPATLFYVAPVDGSGGSGAILSWQALQTSVPDNASSNLSPDAAIVNGGGYAVGDVLVVTNTSFTDSLGNQATWTVAPILQVTHYTYSATGPSFTYTVINTPVSSTGHYPVSSDTFNLFPLGYTPSTTVVGPNNYYGAGVNGGVGEFVAGATVNFGPQVFGGSPGQVIQAGTGTTILTGVDTYTGATTVSAGRLLVDGSITSSTSVAAAATLGGTGTISAPVAVTGALIAGDTTAASTGSLTVGNLSFGSGGTLNVLLNGTTAGTGYDQVTATGAVNLAGSSLDLSLGSGFTPAPGTTFDILVNNGGSAITGTFSQGSTITVGGTTFSISYAGGTSGHDVVLTVSTGSTVSTTTTITDNGPNPSLNFGSTVQPVSFLVHVAPASGSVAGDTVSLSDNGVAISGATGTLDASGNATITLSSAAVLTVGTHPISANFAQQGNFAASGSGTVSQVVTATFQVDSATLAGNYVQLVFDGPVDPNTTQLFYSPGATAVAPNITLTGPGGSVKGSLLIDATHPNVATFVATAGELAPGNYTVAVTNSVKAVGGATLASNYSQPLTVASPLVTPVVTAAFVARGPGQTVNIPNSSTGLPITLSGITSAVQSLSFTLTYDPTLLSVTAATLSTDAATNGNLVLNPISFTSIDAHHMLITFTIIGGSGGGHWNPSGGTGTLLTLTATVPQNAPYTDKALLATQSVVLNGTAAQGDDAIDVNAYQGDIDGSHTYTGLDASLIDRVSVGQGTGFSVFKDLDPWIIGSVTASGTLGVTGLDAADVDKAAVGSFPSVIPQPPTGFTITGPLGPDPRLYLAAATGGDGQTVTVQERFNVSGADPSTEIDAIDSVIEYDPSKFTVSNIRAGSLLPGFSVTTNVDAVHGVIRVSEFTANPAQAPNPTDGDVLLLDFTVNSSAPLGPSPLKLAASYTDANNTSTTTAVYNATSALTLGPAPQNPSTLPLSGSTVSPFVTNVDNYFSVVGHSGTEGFPANTTATAGGTVTIPINFSNGPVPFDIAAVDNAIKFNPLLLQVTNVTVGSLLTGFSLTTNVDNTNGVLRTSEFTANEAAVSGGQVGAVLQITFAVNGSASGSIPLYILQSYTDSNNTTTTTAVYDDNGAITLTPAPQGTGSNPVFVTGVDGNLNIVVQPNQPPYASLPVPAVIPEALFNPAAHAGLQTVTPNTVAFSSATGDAIIVTDSDYTASGSPETTTLTLTGSPAGTSSGPVGTLTAAASGQAMVSGGGTQPLVITGSPSDITTTLSSLVYTPGPGFFGTATLTVSTTDNGNSGYGGSLTDVRSTSITVVGLFLSEIDTLKGNTTNPSQYIEVFSTVPSYTIPTGVYLTGINGVSGSTPAAGVLADIFNLSGFTTGSNGYLALLQKSEKYSSGGYEVAGGNQLDNSGTGAGFGSGNTSKFGTVTGVHTGSTRPSGQLATDILLTGAESFLLIQTPTAPTTTTNIDPANTGNPSNQTSAYNGWNVLDSVGILDSASTSHAYAAITFKPTGATGTTLAGSNVVNTGTWVANYVGRIAQNTGSSGADWLGSVVTGTPSSGMFFLGSPNSTAFAGQPLNSIGGPNDWAPQLTVAVNDDSSNQHSQVAELTLTFSTPVNIVDLASDFVLKDASGNPLSINVSDPGTGATTEGASGPVPDSGATQLFVTFNADATHTFNFITPYLDQFGNTLTVGLVDGNYFLNTKVADISAASNSAVLLDGAKNGMSGSTTSGTGNLNGNGVNQVDEFWRLFGDTEGRRQVDGVDTTNFRTVNGVTQETSGMTAGILAASESNNTVTITTNGPSGFLMGEIVNIVGLPAGYNGSFVILSVNGNTFTYMAPTSGLTAVTNPTGAAATLNSYQWYLDYNEDGNIDVGNTLEQTQLINRLFTQMPA